jgi:hypothetical protein
VRSISFVPHFVNTVKNAGHEVVGIRGLSEEDLSSKDNTIPSDNLL